MSNNHKYDLAIIGSGPGGYVAAIRAAQRLSKGVEFLLKKNSITVIKGRAAFYDSHIIKIDNKDEITAENIC